MAHPATKMRLESTTTLAVSGRINTRASAEGGLAAIGRQQSELSRGRDLSSDPLVGEGCGP